MKMSVAQSPGYRVITQIHGGANSAGVLKVPVDMEAPARTVYEKPAEPETKNRMDFRIKSMPPASRSPALLQQVWANLILNAVKYFSNKEIAFI